MRKALIDHSRHLNKVAEVSPFATNNRWKPLNLRPPPCPLPELPEGEDTYSVEPKPIDLGC